MYPLYPLNKTAAVINKDVINVYGRTKDVSVTVCQSKLGF